MKFEQQTERLNLRVVHPSNAHGILSFYVKNRDFLEPLEPTRDPRFYTVEFQKSNLTYEYDAFLRSEYMRVWLYTKENDEIPIGTICFSNFLHGAYCSCMVGYKLDQEYLRQGYMSEALSYLVPVVCDEYHFHRVEAFVMPDNEASIKMLEKINFVREGLLYQFAQINGKREDHLLYTYIR